MRHLGLVILGVLVGSAGIAEASYSTGTATYAYAYASTNLTAVSGCDDCAATVNIPFAFPYWGRTFTQVTVSSNGTATFGTNASAPYGNGALGPNGSYGLPGPTIAVLWDDWNPLAGGDIYTGMVGGAFVIEWFNLYRFGQTSGATTTFELKLFPDGHYETHYGSLGDGGTSATTGLQEDVDTIAQQTTVNTTIANNSARAYYRPGNSAIYTSLKDGFYAPARVRQHLKYGQSVQCSGGAWSWIEVTSGSADWSWSVNNCAGATLYPNTTFMGDTQGFDVATIPLSPVTDVTHGTYHFIRRADFTPSPTANRRDTVNYGTGNFTSKLDYWGSGALDKTTVIVTGFDPLNTSSTAQYLVLLGDLARTMLAEGRDIAIGKFGDGNQRLSSFNGEVGTWVGDAYTRQGSRKVQVAGISMGGVLVRSAVHWNTASIQSKITAWYSVDAPQTGANMGRGDRGIQNLILCNKDPSDPQYRQIFSNPAADMMNLRVASCSCDDEPENSTCTSTTTYHDGYYNSIGWPTAVPHYAVAFGDANTSGGYTKQGSGTLMDFHYTGWFCSEDRDWNGGGRDCNAGSRYLTAADVDTDEGASVCGTFQLRLRYNPSFINTDSALGVSTGVWSSEDGACSSNYPTLSPTYWTGWAANDYNELHTVLSVGLRNQFMTWNRANDPPASPGCNPSCQ